jgi:hypothetical protein
VSDVDKGPSARIASNSVDSLRDGTACFRPDRPTEGETMPLIPVPFDLPPAFLDRLRYHHGRRIVAVWWEPAGDEAAFSDGIHGFVGADHYVYWELTRRPAVCAWLAENRINLGNSDQRPSHWLLIDRATDRAYVCDVASARDHVLTQVLEDWAG